MDALFLTTLDDIPALLRWVDSSVRTGCMCESTADDWRLRIEDWRLWLLRTAATSPSDCPRPRA